MRIAQIMAGAPNGGAELFYERMTLAIAEAGNAVLPIIRTNERRARVLREAGLVPRECRFGGALDLFTTARLRKSLREFKTEIAIAWMSRAAFHTPRGDWTVIGRLGGYYNLKYFRSCSHLVGNTQGIVRWIEGQGWPAERVHYLPNFVEIGAGGPPVSRAALGVPEDARLLLALGRLHRVKGFDILVQALALMPNVYCVIAGEGPERARLQAQIVANGVGGRVQLLGWRDDTGALLRAADLFVCSSRHEPLGNVLLEAFAAGTPVLAASSEGPSEVIRNDVDGILVPIDDAGALAAAAHGLLERPAAMAALSQAGMRRIETEFSKAAVMAQWFDLLARVRH